LHEAHCHCKALAAWGEGSAALEAANIPIDDAGVSHAASVSTAFTGELVTALGLHRAWDRAGTRHELRRPPAP
jgi:catalase